MNVTIKIDDDVCRAARHHAVDAGLSLSGWVANLIRKEISPLQSKKAKSLLEALGNKKLASLDLDFPRDKSSAREVGFR